MPMAGKYTTVIDFETANSSRSSACSIGLVFLDGEKEVESFYSLIKPADLWFDSFNTSIHGITLKDVEESPEFDEVWDEISDYFSDSCVIAHNASFDLSVLRHALDHYSIEYPSLPYTCSCNIARKAWPKLTNHKLNTVAEHLAITFDHHNALEDARAAALIYCNALKEYACKDVEQLSEVLQFGIGALYPGGYKTARKTISPSSSSHPQI